MDSSLLANNSQHCWELGKSEEQLLQKTVGRLLVNSRPTVGRLSFTTFYENLRPIVGYLLLRVAGSCCTICNN